MAQTPKSNRRKFLQACFAGAMLPQTRCRAEKRPAAEGIPDATLQGKSRVVVARDAKLRPPGKGVDETRLLELLDRSMQAFYDCDSPLDAWSKVAQSGEVVGLKVNCLAGKGISTNVQLVEAVCERLQQAGISRRDIVIWDRLNDDLERAGFRVATQPKAVRCIGNDVLGFEEELAIHGSAASLVCRTLTRVCDAVINLPVLKDHGIVGVTMALKNLFGGIHNPNKYHLSVGDPYVADVYMLPPIRQKVRLTICDATTAQYEGGPSFMPQWTWPFNGLLLADDPVALDYTGWRLIEEKRAEMGIRSLKEVGREPRYIATAADPQHGLGTDDPDRIERVEV